jgi:hypothetical protein
MNHDVWGWEHCFQLGMSRWLQKNGGEVEYKSKLP